MILESFEVLLEIKTRGEIETGIRAGEFQRIEGTGSGAEASMSV